MLTSLRAAYLFHGGKTAFAKILKVIGFQYKKTNQRKVLLERSDVILKRISFLRSAKEIENWDGVVFIDEISLNASHTDSLTTNKSQSEISFPKVPIGRGNRLLLCYVGSAKHGFIDNGLVAWESRTNIGYHEGISADKFKDWFQKVLLSGLPEPSMHNTSYNSIQIQKAPTQENKKEEIVVWLHKKGIDAHMKMLKPELMKLVKRYVRKQAIRNR